MKRFLGVLLFSVMVMIPSAFAANSEGVNLKPKTPQEWRTYLSFRRDETLEALYKVKPEAKYVVEKAEGYAVFTNFSMKIFFAGGGSGRGLVHDNKTNKETFMRMVQGGVGWGVGVKDFRAVFVFDDRKVMENFMNSGWSFGGGADAAAKSDSAGGGAASGAIAVAPGVRVYQLTENGLALSAMVNGTKYWVDKEVNGK
jgi:lipid-binding SYLF domain-containing protein